MPIRQIIYSIITLLYLLGPHFNISAQYLFNSYTKEEGLLSNEVICTFRDSRGFLWIGTKEGLQVYNGKYFKNLRHDLLDSTSISGDWVMAIAEDVHGFIWVGTNKGICKVHPGHLRCIRYEPGEKMPSTVNDDFSKVIADKKGKIWGLTSNYLVCLQEDSFICTDPMKYHGSMALGEDNELLVVTSDQIFTKDTETGELKKIITDDIEIHDYTSIYRDHLGNYWLGCWGDGVILYDRQWKNRQRFKWDLNPVNPSATNIISHINGDNGHVYLGTSNGVYIYNLLQPLDIETPNNHLYNKAEDKYSIISGMVAHIFIDGAYNIWISTSNGLKVCMALNRKYTQIASNTGFTTDIAWREDNLIATSWYGKGVYFFDQKLNEIKTILYFPENKRELNNSQISALEVADDGTLWVATFNGLVHYDVEHQKTIGYFTKEENGFATNRMNDVWVNKKQNEVWTANYDNGITRYNLNTGEVVNLHTKTHSFMINDLVWGFYDSRDGRVWVLTNTGLMQYNYNTEKWQNWQEIVDHGRRIPMGRNHSILKDSRGTVWLGTENGLFIYTNNQWFFKGIENGLPERVINGIVEDKKGNIWISSSNSIVSFDPITFSSFMLTTNNGILLPVIHYIFTDPLKERLFIVSENSMYELNTEQVLSAHTQSPNVYLETFLVNGKSFYSSTDSFVVEQNDFAYQQNNIEISFTTAHIGEVGKLLYSYRVGSNGVWSIPSENNQIVLPQLQPGSYQLEIRATTDGVHWSQKSLRISFTIHPPFWATWWFKLLLGAGIVVILILVVRFISTRNLRLRILKLEKDQAVEKERSRLSRDMHDDLGSGLTKISILSEVVKKKIQKDGQVEGYLENISNSSRELVQNLNNIIWSLNPGNDTLQALLAYAREYAAQFLESCEVNFEYISNAVQIDKEVSEQVRRNIFLVIKESLNNAVRHGKANNVKIQVDCKNNSLMTIVIDDNGLGIKDDHTTKGNGLKNMEKRMKEIGGEFVIMRSGAGGTRVTLTYNF